MVDIIPRTQWQDPKVPVKGPAMRLSTITLIPAHYTAMTTVPQDTKQVLRNIQADYSTHRRYSIGYNFAIDQKGLVYECRGYDIKCAANAGHNEETIAVLCMVDGAQPMNAAMVTAFKALGADIQRRCGRKLKVVCHCDIGKTACPGIGIIAQVSSGKLTPGDTPAPKPPTPSTGDDTVQCVFESQTTPKEFNAMFFGTADSEGRTIELQWSGDGNDPRVQQRVQVMLENFGPPRGLLLAGVKNNRLHPKHQPSDISDNLHQWTDQDFAP